ncbi:MAG: hypothetical protein ABR915_01970 [Thermoguttaceae bacterium]
MQRFAIPMLFLGLLIGAPIRAEDSATMPDLLKPNPKALETFKDMRFGIGLCWGPCTLSGKEISWSRYPDSCSMVRV